MKKGLLLLNIGTPDSPNTSAVRRYLKAFLADKRVIDLPWVLRYILLYGVILPFRPRKSAHAYQAIWTSQGSPLLVYSEQLIEKLQKKLGDDYQVALGMRYGKPSIENALNTLKNCKNITILPLFPQYSSAATGSSIEEALRLIAKRELIPEVRVIRDFYQNPAFIQAQANLIKPYLPNHDYLLFSYHGIPERHLNKIGCNPVCRSACPPITDKNEACYRAQCYETSRLLAQSLALEVSTYSTSFQSRLGKTPWIQPFTDTVLNELAEKGIKNLLIACPAFVTDCLETLEEIGIRAKAQWQQAGGLTLTLVPCLNTSDDWVEAITIINSNEI